MKPDGKKFISTLLLLLGVASLVTIYQMYNRPSPEPGGELYQQHCAACHGSEGHGLRELYPPLTDSPYLSEGLAEIPCLIRKGIKGNLATTDGSYNQRMPAFQQFTAAEITALMVYLQNRWGKAKPITSLKTVEQWLMSCP